MKWVKENRVVQVCKARDLGVVPLLGLLMGATSGLGAISLAEEVDEEPEIGSEEERSEDGSVLGTVAIVADGTVIEKKEDSQAEVAEDDVDDELDDLHGGQIFLPPRVDSNGGHGVVPVHEHVDDEVEGDGNPLLEDWNEIEGRGSRNQSVSGERRPVKIGGGRATSGHCHDYRRGRSCKGRSGWYVRH